MRWLLIDQLLECEAGNRAVAVKTFALSDLIFLTHFPGHPVVPGVLLVELVSQTAAAGLRVRYPDRLTEPQAVHSAKFLRPVGPGDRCTISAAIAEDAAGASVSGVIDVDGLRVSEIELRLAFRPRPAGDSDERDTVIESWRRRKGGGHESGAMGPRAHAVAG